MLWISLVIEQLLEFLGGYSSVVLVYLRLHQYVVWTVDEYEMWKEASLAWFA
jgi:hypothetical protein